MGQISAAHHAKFFFGFIFSPDFNIEDAYNKLESVFDNEIDNLETQKYYYRKNRYIC